jgi:uncharacterized tellurite resistance protein B-like protein
MDERTSRNICEIISGLIFADGVLHPEEERLLARVLVRFGLPADTKVEPVKDVADALGKLRTLSEPNRLETLSLLIDAAAADGVLHPAERILIGAVGDELGIDDEEIDKRLQLALSTHAPS